MGVSIGIDELPAICESLYKNNGNGNNGNVNGDGNGKGQGVDQIERQSRLNVLKHLDP